MGIAYRPHDEQLDRDLALKILPPRAVTAESSRRRFRKEALGLAKLNHPNSGMIHEFGTENGIDFFGDGARRGENTLRPPMRFSHPFTIVPSRMKTTCRELVLHAHCQK
jgi:serine/threonine protein kinase